MASGPTGHRSYLKLTWKSYLRTDCKQLILKVSLGMILTCSWNPHHLVHLILFLICSYFIFWPESWFYLFGNDTLANKIIKYKKLGNKINILFCNISTVAWLLGSPGGASSKEPACQCRK